MFIPIESLKKEAKKLRKNNNTIKNHADSLDFIAVKYGHKNWQELLNNSCFQYSKDLYSAAISNSSILDELKQKAIQSTIVNYNLFHDLIKEGEPLALSYYIKHILDLSDKEDEIKNDNVNYYRFCSQGYFLLTALAEVYSYNPVKSSEEFFKVFFKTATNLFNTAADLGISDSYNIKIVKELIELDEYIPYKTLLSENHLNRYGYMAMTITRSYYFLYILRNRFKSTTINEKDIFMLCKERNKNREIDSLSHKEFSQLLREIAYTEEIDEYYNYVKKLV